MRRRVLAFTLVAAAAVPQAFAQTPAPGVGQTPPAVPKVLATAADVQALLAQAKNAMIVQVPGYRAGLEYRTATVAPAVHLKANEFFYVIQGTIALTVGGTLVNQTTQGADTLRGTEIKDGTVVQLSKGDFYIVPVNTPHSMTPVGGPAADMAMMLPATPPTQ
jgi:mannose-6-phosphate isomerase-like protein (cupin superfamily)